MITIVKGKELVTNTIQELATYIDNKQVIVDIGCGDGKWIYQQAKKYPEQFFIGIDAAHEQLEEITRKVNKKPAKGGLSNIVYIRSAIETLPAELSGIASEIFIHFPWGSLLEGIAKASESVLIPITRLAKKSASFTIFLSYDEAREGQYINERELPALNEDYIIKLTEHYSKYKLTIQHAYFLTTEEKTQLQSAWAKKMLSKRDRPVLCLKGVIHGT